MTTDAVKKFTPPDLLVQLVATLAVTATLVGMAAWGTTPLVIVVGALQLLLLLGFLALVDAPAAVGVFLIGTAAALAADVVVIMEDGDVDALIGIVALSFVGGLLLQLVRQHRTRVTESLADTLVIVVLGCSAACLPAALQLQDGEWVVRIGLVAGGASLLAVRVAASVLPRPALAPGATRSWPGLVLALLLAAPAALLVAGDHLQRRDALLVGLITAATVAVADLVVDLAADELQPSGGDERRTASLPPVSLLLPFALLGPVLLLALRLIHRT